MEDELTNARPTEESAADTLPPAWQRVLHLPCDVDVELNISDYRIADVMQLIPGNVLDTGWKVGRDLPLFVNCQAVAWVEFEVIGANLAVRVTELADDPGEKGGNGEQGSPTENTAPEIEEESHAA